VRRGYVIAGVGTDIGKTHIACALLRLWRSDGKACAALKPVLSGVEEGAPNDATRLLEALGQTPSPSAIAAMSPWRFKAPLAPPAAAALEGKTLAFEEIAAACETALAQVCAPLILIETAGGVMSPLTERHTMLDLIAHLRQPVIFITGSYLGAISHTLTGLAALKARRCEVAAVIVSESEETAGKLNDLPQTLHAHGVAMPVLVVRRGVETSVAQELRALALP
jgi:dethiobiotin synthetase